MQSAHFLLDWDTLVVDHPDAALTRRFVDARSAALPSPHVGRQLLRLLSAAGLTDVTVEPVTLVVAGAPEAAGSVLEVLRLRETADRAAAAGRVTRAQADRWLADVAAAVDAGRFFAAMTSFLAAGTKRQAGEGASAVTRRGHKVQVTSPRGW